MFIIRSTGKSPDALSEALKAYSEKANWQFFEPRFSISARSEADQEVEDVREEAKIVRKA